MRARILIGAAAVAAVALAGCGQKSDNGSPVPAGGPQQQQDKPGDAPAKNDKASGGLANSAEAGKKAGTAKMSTSIEAEVAGKKMTVSKGDGAVDFTNKKSKMSTKMINPATGEPSGGMNVIIDGGTGYLQYLMGPDPGKWLKMDLTAMVGQQAVADMSQYFNLMAGVTQQSEVGKETVNGVETTHYRVTVDPKKILEKYPEAKQFIESMKQMAESVAPGSTKGVEEEANKPDQYDVWADKSGLIYRLVQEFKTKGDDGQDVTGRSITEFSDYGKPVEINPPAESEIKSGG